MAHDIFKMSFPKIYQHYLEKIERKNRTKEELNEVIYWLSGFNEETLNQQLEKNVSIEEFINSFPNLNKNANQITGVICGKRVEEIADPLMQKLRYLDKLVDELAKGKAIDKIIKK